MVRPVVLVSVALVAVTACSRPNPAYAPGASGTGTGGGGTGGGDALDGGSADGVADSADGGGSGGGSAEGSGGNPDGTGGAEGGVDVSCGSGLRCFERPPDGWSGPYVLVIGDGPAAGITCGGEFTDRVHGGALQAHEPTAACCTCGTTPATCFADLHSFLLANLNCTGDGTISDLTMCTNFSSVLDFAKFRIDVGAETPTMCSSTPIASEDLKPAVIKSGVVCGGSGQGSCGNDGSCFAEPPGAGFCIGQSGDADCPDGFGVRKLLFKPGGDFACPSDTCDCQPDGDDCVGTLEAHQGHDCMDPAPGMQSTPVPCVTTISVLQNNSAQVTFEDGPTCASSLTGVTPSGTMTQSDLYTVCCAG